MYILGISCFYHDAAACLLKDGEIIAAAHEERFTRKKHDFSFPINAIQYCLEEGNIENADLDYIGFYEKPFLKFERILENYFTEAPRGIKSFIEAIPVWIRQKLWMRNLLEEAFEGFKGQIIFPEHHESHAASAFFASPFNKAAILTLDGVGEWTSTTYGTGKDNEIVLTHEIRFPHSLGLLYSAFTYYLGFKVNSGEYKVMGLAPYGEPSYYDLIMENLIDVKEDGSYKLNMDYFAYTYDLKMTNEKFDELFGSSPRRSETKLTKREFDIARSVQLALEEVILRMANHLYEETKLKNLCMAGGVALNCVANARVLKETPFEDLYVQPAAGDAGGSVGVASFIYYQWLGNKRNPGNKSLMKNAYLGPSYSNEYIEKFLIESNANYKKLDRDGIIEETAKLIAEKNVVGWFQGKMEFGPRALGNRSIVADPRDSDMKDIVNLKIKFRESFRPFAPTVIEEKSSEYFDLNCPSPYMLLVAQVREDKRIIPAVTHVDCSARIQTIKREDNPLFYDLISEFYRLTGVPVIINTSFNVRGEPIVCTPKDAYKCFMRTKMDYLVLGYFLLDKKEQKPVGEDIDWQKEFTLD